VSVVVSDASALIALNEISQLAILEQLFGTLIVPPAFRLRFHGKRV
jgi:predicted nucleic acid-binding protein